MARANRQTARSRALRFGAEGNARLTALAAVVLLVLLAGEGLTIPLIGSHLILHLFLGVVLIPPVLLKTATTGWRFVRYYLRQPDYVAKGPPHPFLRLLVAPLVVASTAGLFGTGALLLALHPQRGLLLGLHKASFIVWFGAMGLHVLGHVLKLPALIGPDIARPTRASWLRHTIVAGAIVAGVILAIATLPLSHDWINWAASHHRHDG